MDVNTPVFARFYGAIRGKGIHGDAHSESEIRGASFAAAVVPAARRGSVAVTEEITAEGVGGFVARGAGAEIEEGVVHKQSPECG